MVANDRHQRPVIEHTPRVMKQAIPILALVAAVHQISRQEIKSSVWPITKSGLHEAAPAVEPILRITHVNK